MIYVLEDDANIRKLVDYALTREGYSVEGFGTPADFWAAVGRQLPQLVLLDIMLPQEDGLSVLQKLRSRSDTRRLLVIMLTARSSEFDKVTGLDSGADDYIAKPFGMMELISRHPCGAAPDGAGDRGEVLADRQPVCSARTAHRSGRWGRCGAHL